MSEYFEFLQHCRPFVRDSRETLSLHFSIGETQSMMSRQRPFDLELAYTKTMMGFLLAKPNPSHILMIGLGGGSLAKFCYQNLQQARITVVEINPHVIARRRQFLIPDDDQRFNVVCADGADFVLDTQSKFDVVMVDGFDQHGVCAQLSTRTFYENCFACMTHRSVFVVNLDAAHPAHPLSLDRIGNTFMGNSVEIGIPQRNNCVAFAGKGIPISARGMSLSWTLEHHAVQVQAQLKTEFARILEILDSREPLGHGLHPSLDTDYLLNPGL